MLLSKTGMQHSSALEMSLRNGSVDVQSHMAGGQAAIGSRTDHGQGCSCKLKLIHGCCCCGFTLCCPGVLPVVCVLQMMMRGLSPLQGLQQQRQEVVRMLRMCVGLTQTWLSGSAGGTQTRSGCWGSGCHTYC